MLRATDLSYPRSGRPLLAGVSLDVSPGQFHAVLGPNGAGKSTLLKLLAGDLPASSGTISLDGRALPDWPLRELASRRAVLPQQESLRFGFTARDVVALGRLPCAGLGAEGDTQVIDLALQAAGVAHLADRRYPELSGGERARVQFARVLAQVWDGDADAAAPPRYLLLDEPTASLDLAHQYDCLRQARAFARRGGGVLAVLHDPNQVMAFADRVSLLREGRIIACGPPLEVLSATTLSALYGINVQRVTTPGRETPVIVVDPAAS